MILEIVEAVAALVVAGFVGILLAWIAAQFPKPPSDWR